MHYQTLVVLNGGTGARKGPTPVVPVKREKFGCMDPSDTKIIITSKDEQQIN